MPLTRRTIPALGALGVLLGACSKDAPTSTALRTHPASITIASDGGRTAAAASVSASRVWPTIALRQVYPVAGAMLGGSESAAIINSPFDLTSAGGPVMTGGTNWALYTNCTGTAEDCWGSNGLSPTDFLKDINYSRIISILDQYVGRPAYRQWGFDSMSVDDPNIAANGNVLTPNELYNLLYTTVHATGASGYTNMYHVFLPQGVDVCTSPGVCYSPDNGQTFYFCAYHGSVRFSDGTHIIYSVEPYQAVPGCQNPNGLPHGVIDASASTLSHEFFEAATDPDLSAWYNVLTGQEIADLCFVFEYDEQVAQHHYQIQSEYSNKVHACSDNAR